MKFLRPSLIAISLLLLWAASPRPFARPSTPDLTNNRRTNPPHLATISVTRIERIEVTATARSKVSMLHRDRAEKVYLTDPASLVDAIGEAEGVPSYGVITLAKRYGGHQRVPAEVGREAAAKIVHRTYHKWVRVGKPTPFIRYLQKVYAPVGAQNDPSNLNRHWSRNVMRHLK